MTRKNGGGDPQKKTWEHSRYKDWRPSYTEEPEPRGRGGGGRRYRDPRPRRSVTGILLRIVIWIAIIVGLAGPGADYVNGMAKAPEGGCAVRVVVDGGRLMTGCPDGTELPRAVAGYDAPDLLAPGCWNGFVKALESSLELRKLLYAADVLELRGPGAPSAAPVTPEGEVAPEGAPDGTAPDVASPELPESGPDAEPAGEDIAEDTPPPETVPFTVPDGRLWVLADGVDVAEAMLASGTVAPVGEGAWCE